LIRHREPPLGGLAIQDGVAIQGGVRGAVALDCFVAALLAMTWDVLQEASTRRAGRNSLYNKRGNARAPRWRSDSLPTCS
jgi:hypothetical protein